MPNLIISSDAAKLIAKFQLRITRSKELTKPLTDAGALAVSAAKMRFRINEWEPNNPITVEMKGSSRPGTASGKGKQSITADEATATSIRVGTDLPYMRWLQEGTGIYGPRGTPIVPIRAKALAFGGYFFKSVKGQPKRPFLYFDDPLKAKIRAAFSRWLNKPLEGG